MSPELTGIVLRTLLVSGVATLAALLVGIPVGYALARSRFPGRTFVLGALNTGMGMPPVVVGLVVWLLDGDWWVGVALGLIAVVMATLGDLCESVIKRDLGIKDMSQVVPGHGGLMDRLDSLLATIAPIWLLLHYAVF